MATTTTAVDTHDQPGDSTPGRDRGADRRTEHRAARPGRTGPRQRLGRMDAALQLGQLLAARGTSSQRRAGARVARGGEEATREQ